MLVPARAAVRRQQFELLRKHLAHRHDMSHHEVARGAGRTARDDNVRERCDAAFVSNRGIQDGRVVIGEYEQVEAVPWIREEIVRRICDSSGVADPVADLG